MASDAPTLMSFSLHLIIQKQKISANIAVMEQEKPKYRFPVNSSVSSLKWNQQQELQARFF